MYIIPVFSREELLKLRKGYYSTDCFASIVTIVLVVVLLY